MIGVATDLARGKMYDIEEMLLKDGFTDTDQSQTSEQCFEDEGWPTICYSYKVEELELPSFDELQAMAQGRRRPARGCGLRRAPDRQRRRLREQRARRHARRCWAGSAVAEQDIDSTRRAARSSRASTRWSRRS